MRYDFRLIKKAIPTLAVGIAFFFLGCYPGKVVEKPPVKEVPKDLFAMAELDFQAGNYDKAIKKYEHYLVQNPRGEKSRKALYRIGKINYSNNLYDKALTVFKRITLEYPDHPELPIVKYDIANAYYRLGDYRSSLDETSEWLRRYPDNPFSGELLFLMGRNFRALGDKPKAFFWWLKAAKKFDDIPNMREEIENRIIGLIKGSGIEELEDMAEYATGNDYATNIYHRMASIYLERNVLDKARDAAMALVRSTSQQNWVSIGRQILERIESELSTKEGVIGCLLPLSGPFAIYGQEALNGIQLGMDIFNSYEGEIRLELIIKDTKGKAEEAILGVEELAKKKKVMAIIGPLTSKSALAAAKKAQELEIPIITLTQKEGITAEGKMVFRNFLTPSKEIKRLLDKAIGEMEMGRFAILYPDNPYGRFFMNLFWDRVDEMGGEITAAESYKAGETDFAVEIKKMVGLYYPRPDSVVQMLKEMKNLEAEEEQYEEHLEGIPNPEEEKEEEKEEPEPIVDFDAVFIPDNYQQVAMIAPQFPFYNIFNVHLLGTSLWQSSELIKIAGNYVQGAIFPSGFFIKSESVEVKEFVEAYKKDFETEPGILAATGYDTIKFLKNLMDKGMIRTRRNLEKGLYQNHNFYGVTGKISFDHQGEVEKDPVLLTISGKRLDIMH